MGFYAESCRVLTAKSLAATARDSNYYKLGSLLPHYIIYPDGFMLSARRRDVVPNVPTPTDLLPDPGVEVQLGQHWQHIRGWWERTPLDKGKRFTLICPGCQAVCLKLYLPSGMDRFFCRICYRIRHKSTHKDRLGHIGGMSRKLAMLKSAFHDGHRWGKKRRALYRKIVDDLWVGLNRLESILTKPAKPNRSLKSKRDFAAS